MDVRRGSVARSVVVEVRDGRRSRRQDTLAVEEPLEVRLCPADGPEPASLTVTMRTPGHDFELVAGFLFSEGIIGGPGDLLRMTYCVDGRPEQQYNVVNAVLRAGVGFDPDRLARHVWTNSSCGLCGKATLDAIRLQGLRPVNGSFRVPADLLAVLPETLRRHQRLFDRTGGLHAAALFDEAGRLVVLREDVGRHNAVDKLVGERLLAGALPLDRHVLLVSGRASFEIMQKALAAGISVVCAVSAPSSLAVDLAREFGMVLVGFLRGARFNVYSAAERVLGGSADERVVAGSVEGAAGGTGSPG